MAYGYKYYYFHMSISAEKLLSVYRGEVTAFRATADSGVVVELDVRHLRQFTTNEGIYGYFRLTTTSSDRFVKFEKLG